MSNNFGKDVGTMRKAYWLIIIISLIGIYAACDKSPVEDDSKPDANQPNLEAILKDMVLIPAGEFLMGALEDEGAYDEHPQHKVYLDDYYIDKYEVTNAQFKEFVEATGYVTDAERKGSGTVWNPKEDGRLSLYSFHDVNWQCPNAWRGNRGHPDAWEDWTLNMNYPVVQVSWNDTRAYAKWAGKRLPMEAEWEKAARGDDARKWPWGNEFYLNIDGVTTHANIGGKSLLPAGCFSTGISSYGVYNLTGNVQEWVADWYAPDYYTHSPKSNPKGPNTGIFRVLRGGSWKEFKGHHVLNTNRAYQVPEYSSNFIGFRCAWSKSLISQNASFTSP